jgi:sulfonate transport system permease protein
MIPDSAMRFAPMSFSSVRLQRLAAFASPLLLLVIWEAAARAALFPATILVPPEQVFRTFLDLASDGELLDDLRASTTRVISGFLIGGGTGFVAGLLLGLYPAAERYLGLLFHALRQVPFIAWAPLLIIAFGIGETFKIVIIANAAFFPVALNTLDGVRNVPARFRDVAALFRFSRLSLIRKVVLPAALPSVLTGIRLALSRSWMIVVAAELFAASSGIGHMMDWARQMFQIDVVMVGVIVTGAIGFLLDQVLRSVEAHFSAWKSSAA